VLAGQRFQRFLRMTDALATKQKLIANDQRRN
jgi:hypothetical protein